MSGEIITIDTREIALLAQEGSKLVLTPNAEAALVNFMKFEELLENTRKHIQEQLEQAMLNHPAKLTAVSSDRVRVKYQQYGAKYVADDNLPEFDKLVSQGLVKSHTKYTVDSKMMDEFMKSRADLPIGIRSPDRPKKLSFSLKKKKEL